MPAVIGASARRCNRQPGSWMVPQNIQAHTATCAPQLLSAAPSCSRGVRLDTVLMMEPAQNRRRDDSMSLRQLVTVRRLHSIRRRIRKARPQAAVWAAAIVMRDPQSKDPSEMPLIERNHEIQAFAADRSHQSFAKCVRLRCVNRRSEHRQTHRRQAPSDALRINAVAIVDHVAMRLVPRHGHSELLPGPVSGRMRRHVPVARFVACPPPGPRIQGGRWR